MIDRDTAERLVRARLSPGRVEHSRRVAATAAGFARRWGASAEAAELAGLLHDCRREASADEILAAAARHGIEVDQIEARRPVGLLHGPVAAAELKAAGLDGNVAAAIARHTVGGAGMTVLEKCLYLADYCEPGRDLEGLDDIRRMAQTSLDAAVAAASRQTLLDLIERGCAVLPEALELYNEHHVSG